MTNPNDTHSDLPEEENPTPAGTTADEERIAPPEEEGAEELQPYTDLTTSKKETGAEFAARYHDAKTKEMEKLSKEMEDKQTLDNKTKRRNWWIKTVLLLLLIGVSVFLMFELPGLVSGGATKGFVDMVKGINWVWFVGLIGILLFYMLVESAKYSCLLKISTGKLYPRVSIKTMFLGKYYDGVTPLGTGGQPFQIYYLHKKKIPAGAATSVPLVKYIVSTFVFCIVAVVLMAIAPRFFSETENNAVTLTVRIIAWVSVAAQALIPIAILFVSVFPRAGKRFILWIVKILNKLRIVKRPYSVARKYVYEVTEYRHSLKFLAHKWWKMIPLVCLCIVEVAAYIMTPFFVVVAIADVTPTAELLLHICCLCMIAFYSASLIPTPGNSVAAETTTSLVFISVAGIEPVLGWVVLFWRFTTFYVYILSGIGINIFEIIRGAVRNKRAQKLSK